MAIVACSGRMGIYAAQGLEYMFQFKPNTPGHLIPSVQHKYFAEVKRLLVIPMGDTNLRLRQSDYYALNKQGLFGFSGQWHRRRIKSPVDIIELSDEEKAMIAVISNMSELEEYVEHHGWYDNNYVCCTH